MRANKRQIVETQSEDESTGPAPPRRFRAPKPGFFNSWLTHYKGKVAEIWTIDGSDESSGPDIVSNFAMAYYLMGLISRLAIIATFCLFFAASLFVYFIASYIVGANVIVGGLEQVIYFIPLLGIVFAGIAILVLITVYMSMPSLALPKKLKKLDKLVEGLLSQIQTLTSLLWVAATLILFALICAAVDWWYYLLPCGAGPDC